MLVCLFYIGVSVFDLYLYIKCVFNNDVNLFVFL